MNENGVIITPWVRKDRIRVQGYYNNWLVVSIVLLQQSPGEVNAM